MSVFEPVVAVFELPVLDEAVFVPVPVPVVEPVVAVFELPVFVEAVVEPVPVVEVLWACVPWVPLVDEPDFEATWLPCFEVLFVDDLPLPDFDDPDMRAI